ncbi:MAG: RnfABCDGE type electron transport complex subunit B [Methylococcales symbiont of Iophon sp. n. MRB-2018]|nr:MAG: RnfABCDGE type electron transport complex subunit B [Methylococcales symbiont of Iophon sp. n. MRB-2018]KAF3980473.1 MAG: RnfABCDGE type electron transport complex subunit B [Methylococcales symbiont of Iophon sp. n. MRB-2018]
MLSNIIIAAIFMAVLGVVLAIILAIANKKLFVYEDPRIDQVDEMLPQAQCGACGVPGCRPFAEAVVDGIKPPSACTVNTPEGNEEIAAFMGVDMGETEKVVARLACAGGTHVAYTRAKYQGLQTCQAAAVVSGGGKGCNWGCLGLADCADVCDFDAIFMDEYGLPIVIEDKCTACNDCIVVCPKDLFSLQPVSHQLFVACKSLDEGDKAEAECEVACTACEKCVIDAPEGLIEIKNNLAVIDFKKYDEMTVDRSPIERCPTGAIVWIDSKLGTTRSSVGKAANQSRRTETLPQV